MTKYLTNAKVYALDSAKPSGDTIAISQGRLAAVGRAADILPDSGKGNIEDLHGRTVLPGLTDCHIHLLEYGLSLEHVNCETPTRSACLQRLKARAESARPGEWILGHGWDHNIWPDGIGGKADLDRIFPDNPVYLTHKSLHSAWVNTAAIHAAHISPQTPDPLGGHIERNAGGEPVGILFESAMRLVDGILPDPTESEMITALKASQQALLSLGVTAAHDFDAWHCYTSLLNMEQSGSLQIRVVKNIPSENLQDAVTLGLKSGAGSPFLSIGWLKLFADGALGPQTAAMLEPYEGGDSLGMLFLESRQIQETGKEAFAAGISLAIHAIGDRANREVLDGYEKLFAEKFLDKAALRPRIEHVQLITPRDIARLSAMGITASMQPIHALSDKDMAERHWGIRCAHAYAWQSLLQQSVHVIFGSDAPVESPNPFLGIHAAVTRKPVGGNSGAPAWHPQQRLKLQDALRAYVPGLQGGVAPQAFPAGFSPGSWADLSVLPVDIFLENPQAIAEIRPAEVMVAGEWVYSRA